MTAENEAGIHDCSNVGRRARYDYRLKPEGNFLSPVESGPRAPCFRIFRICALFLIAAGPASSQPARVTVGESLVSRPFHDTGVGQVAIYGGEGFQIGGVADRWSFVATGISNVAITPLLFERVNQSDFVLRSMGSLRTVYTEGLRSYTFDPEAADGYVEPNYTFGFSDRAAAVPDNPGPLPIVTGSRNTGVVDFDYAEGSRWYFTSNETFELAVGQIYRLGGTTGGNVIRLYEATPGRRYSAQMSAFGRWPSVSVSIHQAVEICWPSSTNRQYQVQRYEQRSGHPPR
jgi:hypothetical protein